MKTISKKMIGIALGDKQLRLNSEDAIDCVKTVLEGLKNRSVAQGVPPSTPISSFSTQSTTTSLPEPQLDAAETDNAGRDAGVSDAVWQQLQADIARADGEKKHREDAIQKAERSLREAAAREEERIAEAQRLEAQARDQAEQDEAKRRLEKIRLEECLAREERERWARELEAQRKAAELERKKEAKAQAALRSMGVCVAGFRWIKQSGGYRCAGGSHFVSDAQLGM
jgi:hypothetical protein